MKDGAFHRALGLMFPYDGARACPRGRSSSGEKAVGVVFCMLFIQRGRDAKLRRALILIRSSPKHICNMLNEMRVPALVVGVAPDPLLPVDRARELLLALRGGKDLIIPPRIQLLIQLSI